MVKQQNSLAPPPPLRFASYTYDVATLDTCRAMHCTAIELLKGCSAIHSISNK